MNYQKIYDQLVEKRRNFPLFKKQDYYCETHHIVPKCMGGSNEKENLVNLYAKEHFIAHLLLTKIYLNNFKILTAFIIMCGNLNYKKVSSKEYSTLRELYKNLSSGSLNLNFIKSKNKTFEELFGEEKAKEMKVNLSIKFSGDKNPAHKNKGKLLEEIMHDKEKIKLKKEKHSNCMKGENNPMYGSHRVGFNKGRIWVYKDYNRKFISEDELQDYKEKGFEIGVPKESIEKFRKSMKIKKENGIKNKKRKLIICEYCGKELDSSNYKRWHGENCKKRFDKT